MVVSGVGPLLENTFPFEILLERGKVWHRLNVVDFLVHSAEPVFLFQIVWRVRCIRENCSPSGVIILNTGGMLIKPIQFTDILAFVDILLRNWFDMHFIVITDLLLHNSAHELVLVQLHPLHKLIIMVSWRSLNKHSHGTSISIAVVCYCLFVFHFVFNYHIWGALKLI